MTISKNKLKGVIKEIIRKELSSKLNESRIGDVYIELQDGIESVFKSLMQKYNLPLNAVKKMARDVITYID